MWQKRGFSTRLEFTGKTLVSVRVLEHIETSSASPALQRLHREVRLRHLLGKSDRFYTRTRDNQDLSKSSPSRALNTKGSRAQPETRRTTATDWDQIIPFEFTSVVVDELMTG